MALKAVITSEKPIKINLSFLKRKNACDFGLETFEKNYPDGLPLTKESLKDAASKGLHLDWAMRRILTKEAWEEFFQETLSERIPFNTAISSKAFDFIKNPDNVREKIKDLL